MNTDFKIELPNILSLVHDRQVRFEISTAASEIDLIHSERNELAQMRNQVFRAENI